MASSLWKYRWNNTWYGDRKFDITGNWRAFASPYYATYIVNNVLTIYADLPVWIDGNARLCPRSAVFPCPARSVLATRSVGCVIVA